MRALFDFQIWLIDEQKEQTHKQINFFLIDQILKESIASQDINGKTCDTKNPYGT